jgi:transcriptional regulator of arginine metabolism
MMLTKRSRQQVIKNLVSQQRISTQLELVNNLKSFGCDITQATVSRDIRELGLEKGRDSMGRARYILPETDTRRDPVAACGRMLREFAVEVTPAQNLVVVKSEVGTAPGMGRVIDQLDHTLIIGTVAGDDTVLIVTEDREAAEQLASYLRELGG